MAGTLATVIMLSPECLIINSPKSFINSKPMTNPTSRVSLKNLRQSLIISRSSSESNKSASLVGAAMAGTIFSTLSSCDPAFAAQLLAKIAEGDNRGLALLLPVIPAIIRVLYNILGAAINQINRMRSEEGIVIGLGLGGLAAGSSFFTAPSASASEIAMVGEATSDSRGLLLVAIVTPALLWVLYNILQPALNQINRMRSD